MALRVVTPPEPVVTWDEAKAHLRVEDDEEQNYVEGLIKAATAHIDGPSGWLQRAIGVQTLEWTGHCFPTGEFDLPIGPVISIESIGYTDGSGSVQNLAEGAWVQADDWLRPAHGTSWPSVRSERGAASVTYVAGYQAVPADIKLAILMGVAALHANRGDQPIESAIGPKSAAGSLLSSYKVWRL